MHPSALQRHRHKAASTLARRQNSFVYLKNIVFISGAERARKARKGSFRSAYNDHAVVTFFVVVRCAGLVFVPITLAPLVS